MKRKDYIKTLEQMEYTSFELWFKDYPNLKDPRTAITSGLARNIAKLVYEKIKGEGKELEK